MRQMGAVDVVAELNGDRVHRLENIMTMEVGFHTLFDRLVLWLGATVQYPLITFACVSNLIAIY